MEKGCGRGLPQIWSRAAGEALGGCEGAEGAGGEPGPRGGKGRRSRSVLSPGSVMEERWLWGRTSLKSEAGRERVFRGRGAP